MPNPKIEIGYHVGMLEVVEPTDERKGSCIIWKCRCDCGRELLLDTRALQRGAIQDCGCKTRLPPGAKDLTGRTFGRLYVVGPTDKRKYGCIVWRCLCDCDNVAYVPTKQLTGGYTKSCGCLGHPPLKDYVGKRFGQLTIIAYEGKWDGQHYWRCKCDCGNETVVRQSFLQHGHTKSCGCLHKTQILENLNLVDGTSVTILEATKKRQWSSNTSGYTGVHQNKRGKWIAQLTFKRKTYCLGTYDKLEDAVKARKRGEEVHDDFLNWYYSVYLNEEESDTNGVLAEQKADQI